MKALLSILMMVVSIIPSLSASDLSNLSEVALLMAYDEMGQECEQRGNRDRALFWYTLGMKTHPSFYECRFVRFNTKDRKDLEEKLKLRQRPPDKGIPWSRDTGSADAIVYVYAEEGFGDTVHFSRYLHCLADDGYRVIFRPQEALAELMRDCLGEAITVETDLDEEVLPFDCYVPLLSLPHQYLTKVDEIPGRCGYLTADPERVREFGDLYFDSANFKVGIVWQGCPDRFNDEHRSLPLREFVELTEVEGVQLYSLQVGLGREQIAPDMPIVDLGCIVDDFSDTAAMIANLDLLITIDTAAAHLGGAMGHPTWVLIPAIADWRWFQGGSESPWYDSVTLFRQRHRGEWSTVIQTLKRRLQTQVSA